MPHKAAIKTPEHQNATQLSQEVKAIDQQNLLLQLLEPSQTVVFKGKKGQFVGVQPGNLPCALVNFSGYPEPISGASILEISLPEQAEFTVGSKVLYEGDVVKLQGIKFSPQLQEFLPFVAGKFVDWHEIRIADVAPNLEMVLHQPELIRGILRELLTKEQAIDELDLAMSVDIPYIELRHALNPLVEEGILECSLLGYLIPVELKQAITQLLDSPTPKPQLADDAPIAVVFCAGGGGIEAGLVEAGIKPVVSVEMDTEKPDLSHAMSDVHERNFGGYGCKVIRQTIQEVAAEGFPGIPRNIGHVHISPVCANFSLRKKDAEETEEDIAVAKTVIASVEELKPETFSLEQVRGYLKSTSFEIIKTGLEERGYHVWHDVINMADLGLPQSRERLILTAAKSQPWVFLYQKSEPVSWYEAISHLIPLMPDSELCAGQEAAIMKYLQDNDPTPLLIRRVGTQDGKPTIRDSRQPAFTLTRSMFTDQNKSNRNKFLDIWLPDGTSKAVTLEAAAILQGFPDWYQFTGEPWIDGSIIGYSVPPLFAKLLFQSRPQADDRWNPAHFDGEVPKLVEPNGQVTIFDDHSQTGEPPLPEDYPNQQAFAAAWQAWELQQEGEQQKTRSAIAPRIKKQAENPTPPLINRILPDYHPGTKLTREQAEKLVDAIKSIINRLDAIAELINKKCDVLRVYINLLDEGEGYKQLGYANMNRLFKSGVLGENSRSKLQKEWQCARVERDALKVEIGTLPQDHGQKLYKLIKQPEQLVKAYNLAKQQAGDKKITGKLLTSAIQAITGKAPRKRNKNQSGWVNDDGPRHYVLNVLGTEKNFHDQYQEVFVELENCSQQIQKPVEEIAFQGLLQLACQLTGLTETAVLAKGIETILQQMQTQQVKAA